MKSLGREHERYILQLLRDAHAPVGSSSIMDALARQGVELSARSIRLHLEKMEIRGWVGPARRGRSGGRMITEAGLALLQEQADLGGPDYALGRAEALSLAVDVDVLRERGHVATHVVVLKRRVLVRAVDEMRPVFQAELTPSTRLFILRDGEKIGGVFVPEDCVAIAIPSALNLSGILLGQRIPARLRFALTLKRAGGCCAGIGELLHYDGSTLDPEWTLLQCGLGRLRDAALLGEGTSFGVFYDIPASAQEHLGRFVQKLRSGGFPAPFVIGEPGKPLLGLPVEPGRCGLLTHSGLNLPAALKESKIPYSVAEMQALVVWEKSVSFQGIRREIVGGKH